MAYRLLFGLTGDEYLAEDRGRLAKLGFHGSPVKAVAGQGVADGCGTWGTCTDVGLQVAKEQQGCPIISGADVGKMPLCDPGRRCVRTVVDWRRSDWILASLACIAATCCCRIAAERSIAARGLTPRRAANAFPAGRGDTVNDFHYVVCWRKRQIISPQRTTCNR